MAELTDSYYGDDVLFTHFWQPAEINSGFEGIGVQQSDWNQLKSKIMDSDEGWYCDETECISTDECISHTGQISDYTFTLSNKNNYTVSGDELLTPVDIYQDENYYYCKLLLFNNGENYLMGDTLLRHYYSVYDIERYQVGLGKLAPEFLLNYVPPVEEQDEETVDADVDGQVDDGLTDIKPVPDSPLGPGEKIEESEASNKVVKIAAVAIFIVVMVMLSVVCLHKWRKRKEDNRKLHLLDPESTSGGISTEEDLDRSDDGDDELLG